MRGVYLPPPPRRPRGPFVGSPALWPRRALRQAWPPGPLIIAKSEKSEGREEEDDEDDLTVGNSRRRKLLLAYTLHGKRERTEHGAHEVGWREGR